MRSTRRAVSASLLLLAIAALTACQKEEPVAAPAPVSEDADFQALADRYVDEFTRFSPVDGTRIGDHRHDRDIDDLTPAGVAAQLAWDNELLAALGKLDRARLSRANQVDAALLDNALRGDAWSITEFKRREWDPLLYNDLAGGAIYNLMAREFAPLPDRLKAASARLHKLGTLYETARANLIIAKVPPVYAEQVKNRNRGVESLIDEFLKPNLDQLAGADRDDLSAAIAEATKAVEEHQRWIETALVPKAQGEFRVGARTFDTQLAFTLQSKLDRAEIRKRADSELKRVREEMYGIARGLLAGKPKAPAAPDSPTPEEQQKVIVAGLELAAAERPPRDKLVDFAKDALTKAAAFAKAKDLITIPSDPIDIILMPQFQRGFAVAYCDSPGPLDVGQKTFFAISPIPDDWDRKRADSFLREYNTHAIQDVTFHEAVPGHYLQIAQSNRYPSKLRSILASGTFVEGWGVYAERVMTDAGFLDNDPLMKLVNRKMYLRAIANAILDQGVHVDGMTREEAMYLMTHDVFQEEREAAGKWVRAELSSTQLSTYFVGFQEHWDLREEAGKRAGETFNLKTYNDRVISFGSPPVRFVRALMFDMPIEP